MVATAVTRPVEDLLLQQGSKQSSQAWPLSHAVSRLSQGEDVTLASQDTTYVPRPWSPEQHYRMASLCALLCLRELMCRPSSETDMFIKSAFLWLPHYPQPSYFRGSFYKQVTYMRLEKTDGVFPLHIWCHLSDGLVTLCVAKDGSRSHEQSFLGAFSFGGVVQLLQNYC